MLRNGGNLSQAINLLFPDPNRQSRRTNAIAVIVRKQPIVQKMIAEQAARALAAADEALDRYGATADRTAEEMARLAFAQMRDVVDLRTETDPNDPKKRRQVLRVRDFIEINDDAHRAIVKVTQRVDGTVTIELGDKLAALNSLARLKGWIADKPADNNQAISLIIQR
jgi:hypothetical protein